jgi:hypothetical protein
VKSKVTYLHLTEKRRTPPTKVIFALLCLYKKVSNICERNCQAEKRHEGNKSKANLQYIVQFANGVVGLTLDGVTKVICA